MDVWWITALYLMTLNAARCPTSSWNIILSSDRLYSWFSWKLYYIYYTNLLHKFITQTQHKWVNDFLAEISFKFSRNIHFISSIFIPEIIDRHVDSGQHLSIGQHHQSAIGVDISNMSRHISDTAKETENDNIRSVVCYRSHFGRQLLTKWNILKRKE